MRLPEVLLRSLGSGSPSGLRSVLFFSPRLGLRRRLGLYLPPGWGPGTPSAWLFRGHHREWLSLREDASRKLPLPLAVERAVARGLLPPVIVVIPCFGSDDRRFHACAADWVDPGAAEGVPGVGLGAFESSFLFDLLEPVEGTLGLRGPRIALGFSLGGLTVLQLALRHPGLFAVAAAYDGSFFHDRPERGDSILESALFHPAFGRPRDLRRVERHSPVWLARHLPVADLRATRFHLQSGPQTREPWDSNYFRNDELVRALEERGVRNESAAVDPRGRHDWATADRFGMRILMRVLKPRSPS